jgi:hypothetical protein
MLHVEPQRHAHTRRLTCTMFWSETARLECVRGTPFGRLVVPQVWRKRATSAGRGGSLGSAAHTPRGVGVS